MELLRLAIAKKIVDWAPKRLQYRLARFLYPCGSPKNPGVRVIIDYLPEKFRLKFLLDTHDHIGWNIFFFGAYEPETNDILIEYLKPGMTVIEAGANHGSESVIIAELVAPGGHLYAFEPMPAMVEQLQINLKINQQESRVSVEQLALGDADTDITFHVPDANSSNPGQSSKYRFSDAAHTIEVRQVTLDNWIKTRNIERVDFIKMDIQGAELDLLRGGENCLSNMKPFLYLEADDVQAQNSSHTLSDIYDFLSKHHYEVFLVKGKTRTVLTERTLIPGNWLAIPLK